MLPLPKLKCFTWADYLHYQSCSPQDSSGWQKAGLLLSGLKVFSSTKGKRQWTRLETHPINKFSHHAVPRFGVRVPGSVLPISDDLQSVVVANMLRDLSSQLHTVAFVPLIAFKLVGILLEHHIRVFLAQRRPILSHAPHSRDAHQGLGLEPSLQLLVPLKSSSFVFLYHRAQSTHSGLILEGSKCVFYCGIFYLFMQNLCAASAVMGLRGMEELGEFGQ